MKTSGKYFNYFIIIILLLSPVFCFSQKGSVKIFSEVKGIAIYLDEELKGKDVLLIDSIAAGTHYLKITKDSVSLYSELITVKANEVTTVLVKSNKETPNNKTVDINKQIEQYKAQRLDVLLDIKYINDANKNLSKDFPTYCFVNETTKRSKIEEDATVWFVAQGGVNELSDYDFALLINNKEIVDKIIKYKKKEFDRKFLGFTFIGAGLTIMYLGVHYLLAPTPYNMSTNKQSTIGYIIFGSSFIPIAGGLSLIKSRHKRYFAIDEAIKEVNSYNQNLKKQLDLPENFEIKD